MSKKIVEKYYNYGIYDMADVYMFVKAGELTEAEYKEITGKDYLVDKATDIEPIEE